ncbi:MAG TPA: transglutaminase-like domain-containing protein, partial [Vicinamibacteria bacterium]|nr:transglutaminase-like domain-containing protein [Vicinamibacteria bacterium]
ACEEYPELPVERYLARIAEMAESARVPVDRASTLVSRVRALNAYLFDEQGFHGNNDDYYDPRNSFLNDVLDRRTGIPVTLSAVYIEVGRRCGLEVEGVSLPGHFIVRVRPAEVHVGHPDQEQLVDPFHSGALLSHDECQARLDRIFSGRMRLDPAMLAPCDGRALLARMLRNLKVIYVKAQDYPRALNVLDLLVELEPESAEERRERGFVYAALDCYGLAASDLEKSLELAPLGPEADRLRGRLLELRHKQALVN